MFEKLLAGATSLAEGIDREIPKFPEDERTTRVVQMESRGAAATAAAASIAAEKQEPVFEGEHERAFYEDLPDLTDLIPTTEDIQEEGTHNTCTHTKTSIRTRLALPLVFFLSRVRGSISVPLHCR